MEFKQQKPQEVSRLSSFLMIIEALVYQEIKSESGNIAGGLLYKFLRPIILTLLIAVVVGAFRGTYDLEYSIQILFLNFLVFFFIMEQISGTEKLTTQKNLLNLPKVSIFKLLLARSLSSITIFMPQMFFSFLVYYFLLDQFNYVMFFEIYVFAWAIGLGYFLIVSLILFDNNLLIQLHQLFSRSLLFLSAVFYPLEILPENFHIYFLVNPLVGIMEITRDFSGYQGDTFYNTSYLITVLCVLFVVFPIIYYLRIRIFFYGKRKL